MKIAVEYVASYDMILDPFKVRKSVTGKNAFESSDLVSQGPRWLSIVIDFVRPVF